MNKVPVAATLIAVLSLAACSRNGSRSGRVDYDIKEDRVAPAAAFAPAGPASDTSSDIVALVRPPPGPRSPAVMPIGIALLAYSYDYGLETPSGRVRGLIEAHEKECQQAGPRLCQIRNVQVSDRGPGAISGGLTLQAEPVWLAGFRGRLASDAKGAGGKVTRNTTTTEDLSRQIIDTEARLKATTALRDRLQALLATHPGKLQELLDTERELARVQGELDATASEAADMRARVNTSQISLAYEGTGVALHANGVMTPLKDAFQDFASIVIIVLAGLVRTLAVAIPLSLPLAGLIWLFWRLRRGKRPLFRTRPANWQDEPVAKSPHEAGVKP